MKVLLPRFKRREGSDDRSYSSLRKALSTLIIMVIVLTNVSAQQQKVTVNVKDGSLSSVLQVIKNQTGLNFVINADNLRKFGNVTVNANDQSVENVLQEILKNSGYEFIIQSNSIIIKEKADPQPRPVTVSGTVKDADGKPLPNATVRIAGTNMVMGSGVNGEYSLTGNIRPEAKLEVSFLGMETASVTIGTQRNINVTLRVATQTLDDVVVTGMVSTDKRLFTGATDQLKGEEIKLDGIADVSRALEGRSAGVSVENVSGTFGAAPRIRIRGATSILGSSKPLWIVDGVEQASVADVSSDDLSSGDMLTLISSAVAGLNADDIESFQILKDGSATSIYGAKAMAGVIVITTKRGKSGAAKINYTGELSTRLIPSYKQYDVMNSQDQMGLYKELANKGWLDISRVMRTRNSGIYGQMYEQINTYDPVTGGFALQHTTQAMTRYLQQAEYRNTDWFEHLFNNSVTQTHSVSITSGTDKARNYISMSVMTDPGWYKRSEVNRYTFNANTSYKVRPNVEILLLGNASYRQQEAPGSLKQDVGTTYGEVKRDFDINPFSYAMNTSRTLSPYEDHVRNYAPFNIDNELDNNYLQYNVLTARFQGEIKWKPIAGLELGALASLSYTSSSIQYHITENSNIVGGYNADYDATVRARNLFLYTDPEIPGAIPVSVLPNGGIYSKTEHRMKNYDVRAHGTYNKIFNGVHILNLYGAMELSSTTRNNDTFEGYGLMYDYGQYAFYDYRMFKKMSESNSQYYNLSNRIRRNMAYIGVATYSYRGKYTINGTIRYEGTNRLGEDRSARWLPTWNIAGAWNVHEEEFMQPISDIVNLLKIKASYSLTADAGPSSVTNSTEIIRSTVRWKPLSSQQEIGLYINQAANHNLTYEKKHEFNIGFESVLFDSRISLGMDFYVRNNFDLIGPVITQGGSGEIRRYANIADMKSKGIEVTLSTQNINTQNFRWITDFTFAYNKNKITSLITPTNLMNLVRGTSYSLEGYPVGALFSIPFAGLDSNGLPTFIIDGELVDQSNYSKISFSTSSNLDKILKYEGPGEAPYEGGINNTFRYKNFTLGVFMTYKFGGHTRLRNVFSYMYSDMDASSEVFKNRWMVPGDELYTDIPAILSYRQSQKITNVRQAYSAYNYSTARVVSSSFVRLKEISLLYTFSKKTLSGIGLANMSLKLSSTNPFLIYASKKLNGQDPEYIQSGGVSSPLAKQFTLTVRVGF